MNIGKSPLKIILTMPSIMLAASQCYAQEVIKDAKAAPRDENEIVVTATRRTELLSKVPASIAAYNQRMLDERGVRNVDDVAKLTPSVNFTPSQPRSGFSIDIRGISSKVGTATTGIYIDDTPIQVRSIGYFPSTVYPAVFDLDRIEILRGPQGTLFGAGSEGGTVRFITPSPSFSDFSAYGRAELANTQYGNASYEGGLALGGPLVDGKIAVRASGYYRRDGGWVDRVNQYTGAQVDPDTNWQRTISARLAVSFAASETLTITPSVFYQSIFTNNSPQYWNTLSNPKKGAYLNGDPLGEPGKEKFTLLNLKADYDDGNIHIVGNVSKFDRNSYVFLDYSTVSTALFTNGALPFGIPGYTAQTDEFDHQHNWNAELRISPSSTNGKLNWLAGVYYERLRQNAFEGIGGALNDFLIQQLTGDPTATAAGFFGQPNVQPGDYSFVDVNSTIDEQIAGFAEINYNITSQLKLTAGVRVAHSKVQFSNLQEGPLAGPTSTANNATTSTPITPKFSISYQADDNNLFYAAAAKGYRIGGGNASLPGAFCQANLNSIGLSQAPVTFDSDSLWSYEVGSKNSLFGHALQIETSAYYIKWKGIQQKVTLPCLFQYIDNVSSAVSKGFELQVRANPMQGLSLAAAAGYNDTQYTSTGYPGPSQDTGSNSVTVSDGDTIGNPPWSITLTGRYEHGLSSSVTGYVYADYIYHSHNGGQSPQLNPASVSYNPFNPNLAASQIVNARLGAKFGQADVSLFVNNIFNETAELYFLGDAVTVPLFKNSGYRPRTIGVTVTFRQ